MDDNSNYAQLVNVVGVKKEIVQKHVVQLTFSSGTDSSECTFLLTIQGAGFRLQPTDHPSPHPPLQWPAVFVCSGLLLRHRGLHGGGSAPSVDIKGSSKVMENTTIPTFRSLHVNGTKFMKIKFHLCQWIPLKPPYIWYSPCIYHTNLRCCSDVARHFNCIVSSTYTFPLITANIMCIIHIKTREKTKEYIYIYICFTTRQNDF